MLDSLKEKVKKEFVETEIAKVKEGDLDLAMNNKEAIDKKLQSGGMKKYAELGKIMFGMLKDYKKGAYHNIPWFTIASVGFVLLYVFNPLDMVPDFIPGVGYVDDFAIMTVVLRFIESDLHAYLDWKIEETKTADKSAV